jgi:sigma-B regulation protein RsbU (phosphoserine phosphatase)
MPNLDLSILVVDDAKFSSAIITKTLRKAGYHDVRTANNAPDALRMMESRRVSLLIADWLMPEMDGLELAAKVRQLDEMNNHFTYIILLTAREGVEALAEAFDRGVDDFINKSEMAKQLLPRVYAADRLADMQNSMLLANQLLIENNRELMDLNVLDIATGLGNQRLARERLTDSLRQLESRGGATSYLLLGISDWHKLQQNYNPSVLDELASGIARRLRHLTRPLDTVCRIADNQFVIVTQFNSLEHCTTLCFKRIHEGVNLKAFKTSAGFISISAGTGVCALDASQQLPQPQEIEKCGLHNLNVSLETGTLALARWHEVAAQFKH